MDAFIPFIHKPEKKKEDKWEPMPLHIEIAPPPPRKKEEKEEDEPRVIIIEL